jgi:hypothetical protein
VYPLGGASLESNQLLRLGLMGLPRQSVLEVGLGVEHRTTCREAGHQLRHRVRVEHGLSRHEGDARRFIAFVEPVKGRLLRREERLRRCPGQRDHELRDHSLHG